MKSEICRAGPAPCLNGLDPLGDRLHIDQLDVDSGSGEEMPHLGQIAVVDVAIGQEQPHPLSVRKVPRNRQQLTAGGGKEATVAARHDRDTPSAGGRSIDQEMMTADGQQRSASTRSPV